MESERQPETESEMEPEMKFKDRSPWHHLIFVEELADDVSDKAGCHLCWNQALGPVFKCLECDFIQHKSCPKPTERDWEEKMKYHYKERRHHLMLVEEVEINGEEEICYGCEEALCTTPAYKCSIPGCSFLFHHSCAQLPHVVHHPTHQDYMLALQSPRFYENPKLYISTYRNFIMESKGKFCNFCFKTSKYLFYGCEPLDFHLHIKCLPLWQSSYYGRHEHTAFITTLMADPFTCQACGEESNFFAFTCGVCGLIMEKRCCGFTHSIQTILHGHYLTFTPSVRQINKQDRIFCRACCKRVNTKYGAYYCERCGFILHLKCARRYEDRDATIDESVHGDCDEHTKYLVEGLEAMEGERFDGPEKIKHFNHPEHDLLLKHEEPGYDKRCEACMRFIFFAPYYGCVLCNFFLHSRCAELPMTITRRLFHKHPLTLCSQTPSRKEIFLCYGCHLYRDGYSYKSDKYSWFKLDVQCGLIPEAVPHTLHEHTLFLVDKRERPERCSSCEFLSVSYICNYDCEFSLCVKCITIPLYVRYRYHSHPLTITNTCDNSEEYYCLICEEKRKPKDWFYWCKECDFTVHRDCILKGNFKDYGHYVSEDHEHPLFFVQKTEDSPLCAACGQPFGRPHAARNQAVECRQCKFVIHRSCQRKMFTKQS